ncbi:MAG TPA: FecR family protein [Bacteroidia bacterium]|nr:FecR family protein [Bacteroidia bacterium]
MDNTENIETLISKFLAGEASPEEAMLLEDWKLNNPKNMEKFIQCQKIFALANKQATKLQYNKTKAWKNIQLHIKHETKVISFYQNYKTLLGLAASILIIAGVYFFLKNQSSTLEISNHIVSAQNKVKHLELNENSRIDLAIGSQLIYDNNFGKTNRNVKLNGSAYFTVKHNETLPFIVDLGNVYVKDLGTKFEIKLSADTDSIHIKVDEGIVLLFDSASNAIEITASERALYIKSTKQLITNNQLLGYDVNLNFENTKLSAVIAQLEEKFVAKIILANPKLNNCQISAKFKDEDLATILAVITETLGLTYEKQNNEFIIKGEACN